jgi:hypothetical protein
MARKDDEPANFVFLQLTEREPGIYDKHHPNYAKKKKKLNSVASVRKQTIATERTPHVGDVNANFCG